jgi:hypothetical protein
VKGRLLAACLLAGLALSACAPADAVRVSRQIGASLYLPASLPSGMRLGKVQRVGSHMAWLSFTGGEGLLSVFESPDPISPPPGAVRDKQGLWRASSLVGGLTQRTALLHLQGAYVEVMAIGIGGASFAKLTSAWQRVGP